LGVRVPPSAPYGLGALLDAGIVLAVATSKLEEYALQILEQFSISAHFQVVAGSTRDGTRLHKGEILEHALGQLGEHDRSGVVMVGDREHDVLAAIDLGVRPTGVTWGYGARTELVQAGAAALVESPRN
jgi:phosphoglycolate phosphatase